jgi:hypothetical protein
MGQWVLGVVMFGAGVVLLRLLTAKKMASVQRSDGAAVTAALFITGLISLGFGLILVQLIAP